MRVALERDLGGGRIVQSTDEHGQATDAVDPRLVLQCGENLEVAVAAGQVADVEDDPICRASVERSSHRGDRGGRVAVVVDRDVEDLVLRLEASPDQLGVAGNRFGRVADQVAGEPELLFPAGLR